MLERILLPTDGSELSERAVAIAATLANSQGSEVIVARVVEWPWWTAADDYAYDYGSPDAFEQVMEAMEAEASAGLDGISRELQRRNLNVRTFLLKGRAALELLALEEREKPDLVVIGTHGRTGLSRFALGSVADRLVRVGVSPVLVVRSFSPEVDRIERALVPLDGSSVAEEALPMVEALAGAPLRAVKLIRAVASDDEVAAALPYVARVARQLENAGLDATPEVLVGDPARVIEAQAQSVDLVVLATHGRSGFDRLRHGSVAEQATRYLGIPVLLVRARERAGLDLPQGGQVVQPPADGEVSGIADRRLGT